MSDSNKTENLQDIAEKMLEASRSMAKKLPILGNVVWLYQQSQAHKFLFFQDIEHRLVPALNLEQYKLYLHSKSGGLPMAFASWAYLSEEAEQAYIETQRIKPADWRSGKNLWLIDAVTPFADGYELFNQVYEELFRDKDVYVLYPSDDGTMEKVTLVELAKRFSKLNSEDSKGSTKH